MPTNPLEYIFPGIVAAQAIHVAVKFGVPDLLASGPRTVAELASNCGAHEPTLERLLRALTAIEMFQRTSDGRYRNTPLTEVLRKDHPQSLRAVALFLPAPFVSLPLGALSESVRTGETAFDREFGESFFTYLASHPQEAAVFNQVMSQDIAWSTPALLRAYDFSRFKRLVDVGGGQGKLLREILASSTKLHGVLFDQPAVVAEAKALFTGDVAARSTFVGGSFFEEVPEAGDAYLLKRIIHDWQDEDARKILGNIRRAISADGRLLLVESLVDSPVHPAGLLDLLMLVLGGRERTNSEFRLLLGSAGFSLDKIIPAGSYSVIECHPI